ncbi:MAG: AAA family ATPase, partial [Alphaproteobacteria bacterium]|nr:AAA family ATPase [Alphaproteobacteria bacterium]
MLIRFRCSNFRSIRDEQELSLVANSDTSLPENVIEDPALGSVRLLRSAAIYGANASGKTNVLNAMDFMKDFVRRSHAHTGPSDPIPVVPFALDKESSKQPSKFDLDFVQSGVRTNYGFTVDQNNVLSEWLF